MDMLTMRVKKYYVMNLKHLVNTFNNKRKKLVFLNLKHLAKKIDYIHKTWYELIKSEKVGLLMETPAKKVTCYDLQGESWVTCACGQCE